MFLMMHVGCHRVHQSENILSLPATPHGVLAVTAAPIPSVIAAVATARHVPMTAAFALDDRVTLVVRSLQIAYPVKVRASAWQPDVGGIIL
jgi:hypothetical protein